MSFESGLGLKIHHDGGEDRKSSRRLHLRPARKHLQHGGHGAPAWKSRGLTSKIKRTHL